MNKSCEVIMGERIYRRIESEISNYYETYKIKPNYIILGSSEYELLEAINENLPKLEINNKKIFDIQFEIKEDDMGFKIGYMREIN